MKATLILFILGYLIPGKPLLAQVDSNHAHYVMEYRGILTDVAGKPIRDSTYSISIKIYTDPEASTAPFWQDDFVTATKGGVFTVVLGSQQPLPKLLGRSLWIGVSTDTIKSELQFFLPSPETFKSVLSTEGPSSRLRNSINKFKPPINTTPTIGSPGLDILTGDILPKLRLLTPEELSGLVRPSH